MATYGIKTYVREILDASLMETLRNSVVYVTSEFDEECGMESYRIEITPEMGHEKRQVFRVEWDFWYGPTNPMEGEGWMVREDYRQSNWFPPWLMREVKHKIQRYVDNLP